MSHDYVLRCLSCDEETGESRRSCLRQLWPIRAEITALYRAMKDDPTLDPDIRLCGCDEPPAPGFFDRHRDCRVILVSDVGHNVCRYDDGRKEWVEDA